MEACEIFPGVWDLDLSLFWIDTTLQDLMFHQHYNDWMRGSDDPKVARLTNHKKRRMRNELELFQLPVAKYLMA